MFSVTGNFLLLIVGLQLQLKLGIYARPRSDGHSDCPSTGIPQGYQRGVNVIHGSKPVFKIDVEELEKHGYLPGIQYKVTIKAQDPNEIFSDVLLWLQSESEDCTTGVLDTTNKMYNQPDNCPSMVIKNTRSADHMFDFKWTTPQCGCVLIRARVESAYQKTLFMEDETVTNGYLTKRVCPQQASTTLTQMSKVERYKLLCDLTKTTNARDLARRSFVQLRRQADYNSMPIIEKEAWTMVFDQKIYEVQQCCNMVLSEQQECFGDIRRHRIDRFCAYGESIVPFTTKRRDFMKNKEDECCWRLGEGRYHCFASGLMMDATGSQSDAFESMDESDPVNDLEDFQTEIGEKLSGDEIAVQPVMPKMHVKPDHINNKDDEDGSSEDDDTDSITNLKDNKDEEKDASKSKAVVIPNEKKSTGNSVTDNMFTTEKPGKEKTTHIDTTASVLFTTETSAVLKKKLQRTQAKLECCHGGKEYGLNYRSGDAWDRCESQAHIAAKPYRATKRQCKNFFMRCCIENSKRFQFAIQDEDDIDDDKDQEETDNMDDRDTSVEIRSGDGDSQSEDDRETHKVRSQTRNQRKKGNNKRPNRRNGKQKSVIKNNF